MAANRKAFVGLTITAALITGSAFAEPTETQKSTYMFGIKCYVANGVTATDARYNAGGSQDPEIKAKAQKSFDVIWYIGRQIGNSDALIREDIDSYRAMMASAFIKDDAFFQRVRSDCLKLGLM